ncbi:uncharacterized protein LOC141655463 [Silene latifolia]|uniref:uncharacterized protein LOC141655463 n=1 Tax=Silene latifolia TaxID=37657 RepID=UPI003D789DC3
MEEIGFGGLLHLKLIKEIPRGIVELLIKAFKPTSYMFRAKKIEFLLSKADVHDVFLLPRVGARVQKTMTGNCKVTADDELKVEWRRKFGLESKADPIKLNIVHDRLMSCNESGDDFKKLFVLYSMSIFLAPTTNYTLDFKLLRAVEDVPNIKNSDWSLYVFEQLVEAVGNFKEGTKKTSTITGCILVLMICYFHRVNFKGDVLAHSLPLIRHWDHKELTKRAKSELATGALGNVVPSKIVYPIS